MPGIIAVSWTEDRRQRAEVLFQRACECFWHFKGLVCTSQILEPGYGIAPCLMLCRSARTFTRRKMST